MGCANIKIMKIEKFCIFFGFSLFIVYRIGKNNISVSLVWRAVKSVSRQKGNVGECQSKMAP